MVTGYMSWSQVVGDFAMRMLAPCSGEKTDTIAREKTLVHKNASYLFMPQDNLPNL